MKGGAHMTKVEVHGNLESALSRFKNKVNQSGTPSKLKDKRYADKPGVKRRNAEKAAKKAAKKKNKK